MKLFICFGEILPSTLLKFLSMLNATVDMMAVSFLLSLILRTQRSKTYYIFPFLLLLFISDVASFIIHNRRRTHITFYHSMYFRLKIIFYMALFAADLTLFTILVSTIRRVYPVPVLQMFSRQYFFNGIVNAAISSGVFLIPPIIYLHCLMYAAINRDYNNYLQGI